MDLREGMIWRELWERLRKGAHQEEPLYRLAMFTNQISPLSKSVSYRYVKAEKAGGAERPLKPKDSLADLYAMIVIMALYEEIDLVELTDLAQSKLKEFIETRLKDVK